MKKLIALLLTVTMGLLASSAVQGGAKEGKIRWSHKKTGDCQTLPVIRVPGATAVDSPGVWATKIVFRGGQLAEFFVIGDGDTDLDLVVKDSGGNIVAKDIDPPAAKGGGSDLCAVRWRPENDEEFTIIIINNGRLENYAQAGCN